MKKRLLSLITIMVVTFSLLGCSNNAPTKEGSPSPTTEASVSPSTEPSKTEAPAASESPAVSEVPEESPMPMKDIKSVEFVKNLHIGWNLGNTLDASGGIGLDTETAWGNPVTTKEMIMAVKEAGFDTLRLPTTWGNHMLDKEPYTIHQIWLDRVKEVVDYGIDNGMYVILNLHHEEWLYPDYENLPMLKTRLAAMWTQIAETFKNYDEHLIFEGMNEPRLRGTPLEWTGGDEESRDVINQLNQVFVDTIRSSGGNNPLRQIMVPTYAASPNPSALSTFIVPQDDHLIVSLHSYTPYNFALNTKGTSEFDKDSDQDKNELDWLFNTINDTFISKGIPVILGEFGAVNKENLQDRIEWAKEYTSRASSIGVPCVYWDNGAFSGEGENFGLIDRKTLTWAYPEIVNSLMEGLQK